jgi:hypothetical protein
MSKRSAEEASKRFQIGEWYLDRPFLNSPASHYSPNYYACRYDDRSRSTRRRTLGTADEEQAKIKLAGLVATAPQTSREGASECSAVLTLAVFQAYMDGRGSEIASEAAADRAIELFTDYLTHIKRLDAPVSFWTPAQQLECAKWLHKTHDHAASYIARVFNVMRSAFIDATKMKMRPDPTGDKVEAKLIASAPEIVMRQEKIAEELKIPARPRRRKTLTLDDMALILDHIRSEHLFRFAIMELCTWARPQAVIDFDPNEQVDWDGATIDLNPPERRQTKKFRASQPLTQCLADWLTKWSIDDAAARQTDIERGREPRPEALLVYKRKRVTTTKKTWQRLGADLSIEGFTQKRFRDFMADQVKKNFRMIPRELRSRWLGHKVRDGSETTDHYESDDPLDLMDVALATDCVIALIAERCRRPLFAIELRLRRANLEAIGARQFPETFVKSEENGGRDRDRTCDPYHVKVVLFR